MTFRIHVTGPAAEAVKTVVPQLVADKVASGITAQDPALWGPAAEPEASKRLGWTEAVAIARPLRSATCTRCSVRRRGTKTPGATPMRSPANCAQPRTSSSGSPATRRLTVLSSSAGPEA